MIALKIILKMRGKWRSENGEESETHDTLDFPLGIPLITEPSAIISLILLTNAADENTC